MSRGLRELLRDEGAAVAPVYVISLFAVLAMAGVGYDYGQLASLDTELQNAADQAALAAATQLNGQTGATGLATTAAGSLVANKTIFASDASSNRSLAVATVTFFATKADAEADSPTTTNDSAARYVKVTLNTRKARYTLTPLIGLFTSPDLTASAVAGMSSSLCGVPPVLMCNPALDPASFNLTKGQGIYLTIGGVGAGNIAFLDYGQSELTGLNALKQKFAALLGYNQQPGDCVPVDAPKISKQQLSNGSVDIPSVITAFNTRFDIYDNSDPIKCYDQTLCSPSDNTRKDVVQVLNKNDTAPTSLTSKDCWAPGNNTTPGKGQGWTFSGNPYRPTSATLITNPSKMPDAMGYPRDLVHAWPGGVASFGKVGNGTWDINAYWYANYGKAYASDVTSAENPAKPTRYEVYKWERDTAKISTNGKLFSSTTGSGKNAKTGYYATYNGAMCKAGIPPSTSQPDRRVISAALVNCTGLNYAGGGVVTPLAWVDLFLVEPSLDRTGLDAAGNTVNFTTKGEVYVEFIKKTTQSAAGSTGMQFVRRDKPFLVK